MLKKIVFLLLSCITYLSFSQGCSDAGFCSMGAMQPDQIFSKKKEIKLRSIGLSQYVGTTMLSPVISVTTLDASLSIKHKNIFQVKVPFQAIYGSLANNAGIGDISLSMSRALFSNKKITFNVSLGAKIPTNDGNTKENNVPLHSYYQTSLGTYDLIFGGSLISKKWLVAVGYQQAMNSNKNYFQWSDWFPISDKSDAYIREYSVGRNLKRGTDIMLRVERNFRYSNFNFFAAALPIFRVTKDEVFIPASNERVKLDGSTGMALTGLVGGTYQFNVNSSVKVIFGRKITQRRVNSDGLTRMFVTSLSYYFHF